MSDEIHAFPDSNIFLHYKPLAQIDWCKLLGAQSVTLVICMQVINELDAKKGDPRLAERAKRAIKEIEEHEAEAKPLRTGVKLEIYNEEIRRDEFPSTMNPDSQDDRIVHMAKKYLLAQEGSKVFVVTADLGMTLRCRAGGIPAVRMQDEHRLENPGDEKDRKLKEAQKELAALKNRQPKLLVSIHKPGRDFAEAGPFACTLTDNWTDLDVEAEVEKQRRAHPKHADRKPSPFGMPAFEMLGSLIKPEQWERYDSELDSYFLGYAFFVGQMNIWGANHARTIRFDVLVENQGSYPATHTDIYLAVPKKIAWIAQVTGWGAGAFQKPTPPTPPQRPNPEFVTASLRLGSHEAFSRRNFPGLADIHPPGNPEEPEVKVHIRPEHGHLIHAKLPRLKHGQGTVLGTFQAVFGSWEDVSPYELDYMVSASELPEKIEGKIPMVVTKANDAPQEKPGDSKRS